MNTTLPFSTNTYFASGYGKRRAKAQGFIKKLFFICLTLLCGTAFYATAQQPTISYSSPQTYTVGTAIGTLTPTSNGVAAQAYNAAPDSLGSGFNTPRGVAVDGSGNVYVADFENGAVKEIPAGNGTPITLGSGFSKPSGIAVDAHGNVYVADFGYGTITEIPVGNGTPITIGPRFFHPISIAVDAAGNLYVIDTFHSVLKEIPAGSNGTAVTLASFNAAVGVAVDAAGNVYVADQDQGNGAVYEIPAGNGAPITLGSGFSYPAGVAVDAAGNVYVADQVNVAVYEIPAGNGTPVTLGGNSFLTPYGIAIDAKGILYVADQGYAKILTISPNGGYYTGPFLPAGLIIDSNTGAISGTPTTVTPAANYTVTGYNSAGVSASATVNIGVQLPDVSLAALTLSNGALNPAFLSGTLTYNANVGNGLTTMTVTPTANNPTAIITVQGNVVTSGQPSQALNLVVGVNTIAVVITDANHLTSKTYTLKITEAQSSNNNLASVTTSAGLAQGVTVPPTITESVMNSVTSLTVTPAVADPNAMVKVNGASVTSGQPSATIPLNVGANTITIIVTAQDTKTKTYTLTVTRAPSANDNLSNLVVSSGTLSPEFGTATNYLDYIANGVPFSITPTVGDATATVTINGSAATSGAATAVPLVVGNNTITIVVTAQNTTSTKTYTVVVNEARSPNSTLFSLITSAGFSQGQTVPATLAESVPNATGTITVTPTMANNSATVTVNGIAVTSGTASTPINLNVGTNTITIVGTAQNGNITTYTLTVTRAPSASLSNLTLSAGTLGPAFAPATTAYTTAVGNGVSSITVTPTAAGAGAIIRINGKTVASGSASSPIALAVGNTSIGITVTAVDNSSTITYNVGVNRARSSNDALLSFKTSAGLAIGVPVPATLTESVVNATSAITVTPTAEDTTATVTVNGATVPSGTASASISLAAGSNTITTVVTAQSGVSLTYTLTVTRAIGSMNTVYQPVGVQNFEPLRMADDGINVHQGVSPNGDGINDYLQIDNITNYPDNKISIMNRNGQLVYEAKGYDNATKSFDGHSNKTGQMQLPGTYFYELDYTIDGVTKHKTGFLVLKY